jgi:hypothetical protein
MGQKKQQRERSAVLQFYADFDLLPMKYKQMLWDQAGSPTLADVKAAWDLVEQDPECNSLKHLLDQVHCMQLKKPDIKPGGPGIRYRDYDERRPIFGNPRLRGDKHGNLVRRVISEAELMDIMAKRKQADEVRLAYVRPVVGFEVVKVTHRKERGDQKAPEKPQQQASTFKMLHNAGGR